MTWRSRTTSCEGVRATALRPESAGSTKITTEKLREIEGCARESYKIPAHEAASLQYQVHGLKKTILAHSECRCPLC